MPRLARQTKGYALAGSGLLAAGSRRKMRATASSCCLLPAAG